MMQRRSLATALLIFLELWVMGASPVVALDDGGSSDVPAMSRAEAIRFRAEMGLEVGTAHLDVVETESVVSATFGLALSEAEEALLQERLRIQARLQSVASYALAHGDVVGGLWLSYPEGSTITEALLVNVAVTAAAGDHSRSLLPLLPEGAGLAVHDVTYSQIDLDALHSKIFSDLDFFAELDVQLHSAFTIVERNAVEIVVSRTTPEIEAAITGRYPEGSVFVAQGEAAQADACSRTNCGPPWRGGLRIIRPDGGGCTAGYVAKKYVGVWTYQLWTAGHCGSHSWRMGSTTGTIIGSTTMNFFNSNSIDVQGIGISSTAIDDDYLLGSAGCTACTQSDIASAEAAGGDIIGAMIQNNGAYSGSKVGTLAATNGSILYLGEQLTNLRRASYSRMAGDSGGPVIRRSGGQSGSYNVAAGSHTHFQTINSVQWALYTHISYFNTWTGYVVHTTGD